MIDFGSLVGVGLMKFAGTSQLALAGFFGTILRMIKNPTVDLKTWLIEVFTGMISAVYLAPILAGAVSSFLKITVSQQGTIGLGFLVGIAGMTIVGVALERLTKLIKGKK